MHGGERIASALEAHGVRLLFTLCGGHISPILTGASARGIRVVDVRHEATAVYAADAVARLTGAPGVAAVTAGPGVTNTITALKNAQLAQSPVLVLGGAAPTALQGRGALQDIDQRSLVAPHVKRYTRVSRVGDLSGAVTEALRVACDGVPGPVFVECPADALYDASTVRDWYAAASGKGRSLSERLLRAYLRRHVERLLAGSGDPIAARTAIAAPPLPSASSVRAGARALRRAERPLMLIGSQALASPGEASALAEAVGRLGIPTYLSGMARGLLGRAHPLQMRHQRRQALRESDCVILAGVPCDFRLDYGRHLRRSSTVVAANRSAREARLNRRPSIAAIGDAGLFVRRLAASRDGGAPRDAWIERLRDRDRAREAEIEAQGSRPGEHVNPIALCRAIDAEAADAAVFVADGGDFVATASYVVKPRSPLSWLDPGVFGTLGVGAGFALAAALVRPQCEVWLLWGDGACGFGLAEFDTFVRHHLPIVAVVGNDAAWTQIAREQVKLLGDDVGTALGRTDYHLVAAGFGAEGIAARAVQELPGALARARAAARDGAPVLVNVWLDRSDFREGAISM